MELLRILRHEHKVLVYWYGPLLKADGPNSFVVPSFYVFMCQCGGVSFDKIFGYVFSLTEVFFRAVLFSSETDDGSAALASLTCKSMYLAVQVIVAVQNNFQRVARWTVIETYL